MTKPYIIWNVNGKDYRLRMTTFNTMQIEKQLGMGMTDALNHLMDSRVIVGILWDAMQKYNHGMNLREVCDLYDDYLAGGGNVEKISNILMQLLAQIGIGDTEDTEDDAKNVESPAAENDMTI
ncbi:MAG TPA: hypothetical protein DEP60_03150 [Ruminococcaceae bacterium]|jgi:hypothetical protein|nr:hypothetical protein [Oscillospiraceae bacterium]